MNINTNSNTSERVSECITKTIHQREDGGGGGDVLDGNVMRGPEKHDKKVGGE